MLTASVIGAGLVPFLFVAITAAPLVKTICLEIPAHVRVSEQAFRKFLANPPPQARLQLVTQRAFPVDLRSTCSIGDLSPYKSWLRPVNLTFVHPKTGVKGKKFWTREKSGLKKTDPMGIPGVWEVVLDSIRGRDLTSSPVVEGLKGLRATVQ
jgi:hypothetical protein